MNKKRYIFLHIEKTAGTSLVNYFKTLVDSDKFAYIHPTELTDEFAAEKLSNLDIVAGHLKHDLVRKYMSERDKITFLRDPIDRVLSFYYYAKEIPRTADPITQKSKDLDMLDFFHFCKESNDRRFVDGMTFKLSDNHGQNELPNALENLKNMDFIGLQSEFNESVMMMSYQRGWRLLDEAPVVNRTKNRSEASQLSQKIVDFIISINQNDIELYNLGKELYQNQKSEILKKSIKEIYQLKNRT